MGIQRGGHASSGQQSVPLWLCLLLALGLGLFPRAAMAAVEGRPCSPEPTDMTIAYGDLIVCQIDVIGDTDVFRFNGIIGELVGINIARQAGGDPCLSVRDALGALVGSACYYGATGVSVKLARTGTFTIQVSEWGSDGTMTYALSLDRVTPPSPSATLIRYAQNLNDEINPIGDVDEFFFSAAAGDTVTVSVTALSGGQPCVGVYNPQGTVAGSSCYYGATSATFQVTQAGTHTIVISEWGVDSILGYRVDLQCVGMCRVPAKYDFDGNGSPDVIWQDPVTGESQFWRLALAQGGSVIGAATFTSGNPWRIVAAGDFDRDGRLDLVWQDPHSGQAQIWYLGGAQGASIVNAANLTASNSWRIVGAGDFNADGRLDLVWQDPVSGTVQVWFLGGALGNVVTGAANLSLGNAWRIAAVADFNDDGHPDVVWQDPVSGISQVWFLGGVLGTTVTGSAALSGPNSWRIVGPR